MAMTAPDDVTSKIQLLKKQAKKHQIFREELKEALKLAEAGLLHLQHASELEEEERVSDFKEAAACLARAKRLSRTLSKEVSGKESNSSD
jgi:hypothetical protein